MALQEPVSAAQVVQSLAWEGTESSRVERKPTSRGFILLRNKESRVVRGGGMPRELGSPSPQPSEGYRDIVKLRISSAVAVRGPGVA